MGKSVYSVVLSDDLVKKLDGVAYKNGVSRSVMLNKIMAEYLTVETPEVRIENILTEMESLFGTASPFRFVNQPSLTMAYMSRALPYRYNPTVKYSVELFEDSEYFGRLRVTTRTQNPVLISIVNGFFEYFSALETKYLRKANGETEDGKFTRLLNRATCDVSAESEAQALAFYVKGLDSLMNMYFDNLNNLAVFDKRAEKMYLENLPLTNNI